MSKETVAALMEKVIDGYLEDYSFEEFLENFNLTPYEVFMAAFNSGLVDETLLESFLTTDA